MVRVAGSPARFMSRWSSRVVPVRHARVAEACKILENTYRAVNIALGERIEDRFRSHGHRYLGSDCRRQDQAVRLSSFLSRSGLGRTLHPIDPFYLTWAARRYGQTRDS